MPNPGQTYELHTPIINKLRCRDHNLRFGGSGSVGMKQPQMPQRHSATRNSDRETQVFRPNLREFSVSFGQIPTIDMNLRTVPT